MVERYPGGEVPRWVEQWEKVAVCRPTCPTRIPRYGLQEQ